MDGWRGQRRRRSANNVDPARRSTWRHGTATCAAIAQCTGTERLTRRPSSWRGTTCVSVPGLGAAARQRWPRTTTGEGRTWLGSVDWTGRQKRVRGAVGGKGKRTNGTVTQPHPRLGSAPARFRTGASFFSLRRATARRSTLKQHSSQQLERVGKAHGGLPARVGAVHRARGLAVAPRRQRRRPGLRHHPHRDQHLCEYPFMLYVAATAAVHQRRPRELRPAHPPPALACLRLRCSSVL